jgi:hypothetical protein
MSASRLRAKARHLDQEAEIALAAGDLELAQKLYQQATILVGAAEKRAEQENAGKVEPIDTPEGPQFVPSINQVAKVVGFAQPTISAALRGKAKIPKDVAIRIHKLRPDLPPNDTTWPAGWSEPRKKKP